MMKSAGIGAVLVVAIGNWSPVASQAPPSIYQRNTAATVVISGSPRTRDGAYEMTGVSLICGEIPKESSLTGQAAFIVEFPDQAPANGVITSITFGSNQLVAGVTTATAFNLSVGVVNAAGGRPPLYVLNTDSQRPRNAGTATLTSLQNVTTLKVGGQNEGGETVDLTLTCS
jgi:hypothetical protein